MSADIYVDTINKVHDLIKADVGVGNALPFLDRVFYGELDQDTTLLVPFAWIRLGSPFAPEIWSAAQDKRDSLFSILITVVVEPKDHDPDSPYGRTDPVTANEKIGMLLAASRVMDFIDNKRADIIGVTTKNLDFTLSGDSNGNIGEHSFEGTIRMDVKQRFKAGTRST